MNHKRYTYLTVEEQHDYLYDKNRQVYSNILNSAKSIARNRNMNLTETENYINVCVRNTLAVMDH